VRVEGRVVGDEVVECIVVEVKLSSSGRSKIGVEEVGEIGTFSPSSDEELV
jgi:hypothetical protein